MSTILYSKEGKFQAKVLDIPNKEDDGYHFLVDVTGMTFSSQRKAIRNARSWLKRKRKKYYKKHPKKRPWVKRQRIYPKQSELNKLGPRTIHKLYKMKRETAKILTAYSRKCKAEHKLRLHSNYSKKKWGKKTAAVSGEPTAFAIVIAKIMKEGSPKERKLVSKMINTFMNEPKGKNGNYIFY